MISGKARFLLILAVVLSILVGIVGGNYALPPETDAPSGISQPGLRPELPLPATLHIV